MLVFHLFFLARQIPIDMMIEYSVRPYNLFQTRVIQLEKKISVAAATTAHAATSVFTMIMTLLRTRRTPISSYLRHKHRTTGSAF